MTVATSCLPRQGILRHSRWDALLFALALAHGALLLAVPAAPVIALGLWWNSNTIAHNFLHRPFFRSRVLNTLFALYLTLLLGVPQSLWRSRHLAHHAGVRWRLRLCRRLLVETGLVLALWCTLLALCPAFFLTVYVPAYLIGLALCALHGHYEHARGTVSHHGMLYNLLFFNDGYHVEHHARPALHWTLLPHRACPLACTSRWPAVLRWLDALSLNGLERVVLRNWLLQRFVIRCHERAFRKLLPAIAGARRVAVVGGGLFPRTLIVLRRLLPDARLTAIDCSPENVATARALVPADVEFVTDYYTPERVRGFDLVVFPLAFVGDRAAVYQAPPAARVVVHDWLWRRRGIGAVVSVFLLKRLNLVTA